MTNLVLYTCIALIFPISAFASASVSSDHVWAIVKMSYDPATMRAEGGPCGTIFFINDTVFLTAHHIIETNTSKLFTPNIGYPKVRLFLVNSHGDMIDSFQIVKCLPGYDLAIGRVEKPHPAIRACPLQSNIQLGDEVYNLGFPTDQGLSDYSLKINGQELIVNRIRLKPSIQQGSVRAIKQVTLSSNDVNIQDKTVVIMDYSSRTGFSGGPLVSRHSGKVVGLISFGIPWESDPSKPVAAIRMADINSYIRNVASKLLPNKEGPQ